MSSSTVPPPPTPLRGIGVLRHGGSVPDRALDLDWQPLQPSHQELLAPVRPDPADLGRVASARLSAVVVPTSRPWLVDGGLRPGLQAVRLLAEEHRCPVVLLASGEALAAGAVPSGPDGSLVVEFDARGCRLPAMATSTFVRPGVREYAGDLAAKRNTALAVSLLCGWRTWHFRDDDLTPGPADRHTLDAAGVSQAVARLAQGEGCLVVGFQAVGDDTAGASGAPSGRSDNSVVAHARRLLGWQQDVFVGGGALVLRTGGRMPFFPRVYNEDWLFLLALAVEHGGMRRAVAHGGSVRHEWYDPFRVVRARREEFGDVLAEGLFAVLHQHDTLHELVRYAARHSFWRRALGYRRSMVQQMVVELGRGAPGLGPAAIAERQAARQALRATLAELDVLRPETFVAWMRAWRDDLVAWHRWLEAEILPRAGTMTPADALAFLGQRTRPAC